MGPRKEVKQGPMAPNVRKLEPKPKLRIVNLEERIAPKLATNHSETLVREPANAKPKSAKHRTTNGRLTIVKLEERIAPKIATNHNETLVREPAKTTKKVGQVPRKRPKPKLQIIKLEQRISPKLAVNHNETFVRDCSGHPR
jgi:hypothetical protein